MSADSFHASVERSLKKADKVYNFEDFVNCVKTARTSTPIVHDMKHTDFFVPSCVANINIINKQRPRPMIGSFQHISAVRGSYELEFSPEIKPTVPQKMALFSIKQIQEFQKPSFNFQKTLKFLSQPVGIEKEKKDMIVKQLGSLMPEDKGLFWKNLPTC